MERREVRPGPNAKPAPTSTAPTESEVDAGRRIRALYVAGRSAHETMRSGKPTLWRVSARYDGKGKASVDAGRKAPPSAIWPVLARWFALNQIDPAEYVPFAFSSSSATGSVEPYQLCQPGLLDSYRRGLGRRHDDAAMLLETQLAAYADSVHLWTRSYGYSDEEARRAVLIGGADNGLSPLFCYLIARDHAFTRGNVKFAEYADAIEIAAVSQYMTLRQGYSRHWSKLIPIGFDAKARAAYGRAVYGEIRSDDIDIESEAESDG